METVRKYKTLKKLIIPILTLVIFLSPFSPLLEKKNGNLVGGVEINKIFAASVADSFTTPTIEITGKSSKQFKANIKISVSDAYQTKTEDAYSSLAGSGTNPEKGVVFKIAEKTTDGTTITYGTPVNFTLSDINQTLKVDSATNNLSITSYEFLKPETTYQVQLILKSSDAAKILDLALFISNPVFGPDYTEDTVVSETKEFTTPAAGSAEDISLGAASAEITNSDETGVAADSTFDYGCTAWPPTWFSNCIASLTYYVLFQPAAAFARLAAKILDFFVYYSTNSSSYSSAFVVKAFGAVRDIANIFFIIALLFVAIKTILGIGEHGSKKIIGSIVVVALLINFSLFFTQVIIDASNILAKVFYNQIENKDSDGTINTTGAQGERSISVGLVAKFNPQNIITQAQYNGEVVTTGSDTETAKTNASSLVGKTIFVNLLSAALMIFMIFIFISIAILFVGRVVALWLAMIFAPIAFASYTIPIKIPGFGHEEWWDTLLKNAFLAPIFIFFLYIIILFGDFFSLLTYDSTKATDWLDGFMKTIIPFAIIFVLLHQAKKLAVTFSGEMGKTIMKGAAIVGGAALGAGLGVAAFAGRSTLGRVGSSIMRSRSLKDAEAKGGVKGFFAKQLRNVGTATGKGTMDLRGAKIAGMGLAGATGLKLGTEKKGGFEGTRERQVAKRQQRAADLKVGEDDKIKQDANKAETQLHDIESKIGTKMDIINADITDERAFLKDAHDSLAGIDESLPGWEAKKQAIQKRIGEINTNIGMLTDKKSALISGDTYDARGRVYTNNEGKPSKYNNEGTIDYKSFGFMGSDGKWGGLIKAKIENDVAQRVVKEKNHHLMEDYAKATEGTLNNITAALTGKSIKGNKEAAFKIRTGAAVPKTSSSDSHSSHSTPHATTKAPAAKNNTSASGTKSPGGHPTTHP